MVYLHDRIRQSDELSRTDVQQYEPNQYSNHNDYKKFSYNMVAELDNDTAPSRILDTLGQRLEGNSTAAKAATATAVAFDTKARATQGTVVQLKSELAQYQQSRTEAKVPHAIALKPPSEF